MRPPESDRGHRQGPSAISAASVPTTNVKTKDENQEKVFLCIKFVSVEEQREQGLSEPRRPLVVTLLDAWQGQKAQTLIVKIQSTGCFHSAALTMGCRDQASRRLAYRGPSSSSEPSSGAGSEETSNCAEVIFRHWDVQTIFGL